MFFNKTNQIIDLLEDHTSAVQSCFDAYEEIFNEIVNLQSKNDEKAFSDDYTLRLNTLEHNADNKRHEVIFQLLQGGFLVDNRKSTMRLVEGVDQVADTAEDIIQMLVLEKVILEDFLVEPLQIINSITKHQLNKFIEVLSKIVTKYDLQLIINDLREIEDFESEVDSIEDELIKKLFSEDMPLANKLQFKQLIRLVSSMSDAIEDLSDEVEIILASRRI